MSGGADFGSTLSKEWKGPSAPQRDSPRATREPARVTGRVGGFQLFDV